MALSAISTIVLGLHRPFLLSNTMKNSLQRMLVGLGCCWVLAQLPGCGPFLGPLTGSSGAPNWYPNRPGGIFNPQPFYGANPWYPAVGTPVSWVPQLPGGAPGFPGGFPGTFPGTPGVPIVMNPAPGFPDPTGPDPSFPDPSFPDPTGPQPEPPTIPVNAPIAAPTVPNEESNNFWSPWPLPPRGNQLALGNSGSRHGDMTGPRGFLPSGQHGVSRPQLGQFVSATSSDNLVYRGGKVIHDLSYVNLYVSGDTQWTASDVDRIDRNLSAAMNDQHLNNVLMQYFDNQAIRSRALPSHPLVGHTPTIVSRGDLREYLTYLHEQGFLRSFDLKNTAVNLILPPGTVLTSNAAVANSQQASEEDSADSRQGLAGYHGSVVSTGGTRIYFAVSVFSERSTSGATNGIPVFRDPWKNVVATLYHQMMEVRTNPDVEDGLRDSTDLNSGRILGWVSDSGLEIGDIPLRANTAIQNVIREVPLANGNGTVPVQLPYSNHAGGPEGPIARPHAL